MHWHLPRPGTRRPLGGGDRGLWIRLGLGTPAAWGRPWTQKEEVKRDRACCPPPRLPQGAKIPRPQSPQGGASRDAPRPKAHSCNPTSQVEKQRPREGEGRSTHAQLQRPPWALTLQFLPSVPAKSCSWNCPGNQPEEERKLPSGQKGHWEWPQQAAYLARDLRLTLR